MSAEPKQTDPERTGPQRTRPEQEAADDAAPEPAADLTESAGSFAGRSGPYYARAFVRIHRARRLPWSWNTPAALLGPVWAAARGLWGFFWSFFIVELYALVLVGRGWWGELGADELERAERLQERAAAMAARAAAARDAQAANAAALARSAENLEKGAAQAIQDAQAAASGATGILIRGVVLLGAIVALQGLLANILYERKYARWRSGGADGRIRAKHLTLGLALIALVYPLTVYRFTVSQPAEALVGFPSDRELYNRVAIWLEERFDAVAVAGAGLFDGITAVLRALLDGLETVLVDTPWPAMVVVIVVLAWRLAGPRVAIFTTAALAYLALLGYWEKSMATVALLGAAAFLCVLAGIPLGIWCAKSRTAYAVARPMLDFMQTMPAFVYLIPVIAFFGTGKPPGVLATLVFGMPPVVRLTALGIRGVPDAIKEAAVAFGCSRRKLLTDVELPLAMPSIMTGINQTILLCLSMVVIASLIGAEGLGSDVLEALQYAAKGQGLLAGIAILLCAMMLDRIVQGRFRDGRRERREH